MCWPEEHTDTTAYFNASADVYYPIRWRFQSGCGGGSAQLRVCYNGSCQPLLPLNVTTNTTEELPVLITRSAIILASGAEIFPTQSPTETGAPHVRLPVTVPDTSNSSLLLYLDPFVLTSLADSSNRLGLFNITWTPETLPPSVAKYIQLNTTFWRWLVPDLYAKFPNDAMMVQTFASNLAPFMAADNALQAGLVLTANISVLQGRLHYLLPIAAVRLGLCIESPCCI
jgi:hypothetical protein